MIKIIENHPFLFFLTIATIAIAFGGAFASEVDYDNIAGGLIVLWLVVGAGYAASKGFF